MFLLYPSLLHEISMTRSARDLFKKLDIPKPQENFVRLPSAASIFQDLRFYQNTAVSYLVAQTILVRDQFELGVAALDLQALPATLQLQINARNESETGLMEFLAGTMAGVPIGGVDGLYRRVGLPGRQLSI